MKAYKQFNIGIYKREITFLLRHHVVLPIGFNRNEPAGCAEAIYDAPPPTNSQAATAKPSQPSVT
jgi:hypothetical protein